MSDYQTISCAAHSIFELAIMHHQLLQVTINGKSQTIQPQGISAKAGKEYLVFLDKEGVQHKLRADYISGLV